MKSNYKKAIEEIASPFVREKYFAELDRSDRGGFCPSCVPVEKNERGEAVMGHAMSLCDRCKQWSEKCHPSNSVTTCWRHVPVTLDDINERDKRIAELEAQVEMLKNCSNCKHQKGLGYSDIHQWCGLGNHECKWEPKP